MFARVPASIARPILVAASVLFLSGCGTRAYEERVDKGMASLRTAQQYLGISPGAVEIPGTGFMIRLPKFIDGGAKAYNEQSAEPNGQGIVNPERLNPPFLKIPGLRVCYEVFGFDAETNESLSVYCYQAVLPAADAVVEGKPIEEWIQTQLAKVFGDSAQWTDVKLPTQAGPQVDWRQINVKGMQNFFTQSGAVKPSPGVFELYTKEMDGNRLLIGWRYPQKINHAAADNSRLSVGSITAAAPANPAPAAN
jgi:hypothetical protein